MTNVNLEVKLKALVVSRSRWTVLAICQGDTCPLLEDLENLEKGMAADGRKILRRLKSMAVDGPPRNMQLGRPVGGEIFEVKAQRGLMRVFYFYDEGRMVICTHLAAKPKKKQLAAEVGKAQRLRGEYLLAKAESRLQIVEEL